MIDIRDRVFFLVRFVPCIIVLYVCLADRVTRIAGGDGSDGKPSMPLAEDREYVEPASSLTAN